MNYKRKSKRRFFLLMRSRTPPISSEFRGGGLNTPNHPPRYANDFRHTSVTGPSCPVQCSPFWSYTLHPLPEASTKLPFHEAVHFLLWFSFNLRNYLIIFSTLTGFSPCGVFSLTPRPLYLLEQSPLYSMNRRLGGLRAALDIWRRDKSLALPGCEIHIAVTDII